ncbi:sulfurtransferase TusA family protein [Zobellella aerophila]|uniref:Sulfurtransferase TusA family protein n=1 Tax=Zobellella aerophila TaxID=870480 RepID=A0ABP6V1U7_9GAMM
MDKLDARPLRCPLPLLEVKLWLRQAQGGQSLTLWLSDAGSRRDVPAYLRRAGHAVVVVEDTPGQLELVITKAP